MSNKNSDYYFLRGGGEMGELIRAKDWSKTSLGDPVEWPQSLRTTLGILLNSKFPMFLWWGPELICLYNDAYRPSLGKDGKHPSILGMPAKSAWTEIWEIIKPLIDKVVNERESIWFEDMLVPIYRNGKIEDVYWTFSYSPVPDDTDKVAGVLVTCVETTAKVHALSKIEERDQRFRNTMKQAPVGITILRGPQYIVEMANDAYLQLIDRKESDFVGKPLFASLPEVEEAVHLLLNNVLNTGVPYHGNEVPVPVFRYGKQDVFYFDFLYHPLREEDGKISGVIVAVTEVTEKVETRKTIEEKKRLYEAITQNTPDLVYVFDLNYRFNYANDALLKMWGRSWDESIGKSLLEVGYEPWHAEMHEREIDQVIATKRPVRGEVSFPHATLGKRIYDYILVPVLDQDGKVEAIAGTTRDITQQVEAHRQIEESEARFRNMVEQAPVSICVLRGENYVVEVANESQLALWGKTKEQVLNIPIFTAIPEGKGQGYEELLDGVFSTGRPFVANELPTELIRNGKKEIFYTNFTYQPLYDSSQKISGIISVAVEVTEQVLSRRKIEASEERLKLVLEASELGTWELNLKTKEPSYSKRYLEILGGYKEDVQLTHAQLLQHLHPDDFAIREKAFQEAFITGVLHYVARLIWHDKSIHWMEGKGKVFYDEENKPLKLIGTIRDITEEKNHEQELKESEEKFRLLADSMPQHIWTSDPEGNLNYYNQSVFAYSGLTLEQIKKDGWIQIVHPDDREENIKKWLNAISEGKDFLIEHRFRRHDGEYRWQLSRAIPQRDENGEIQMWVGTSTDINEQKKAQEQFKVLADQAPMWVWLTDKEVNVLYTNPEVLKFLGIAHYTEFTGNMWEQKVHPEDIAMVYKNFGEAASLQQSFSFEFRVQNAKTLQYEWFYIKAVPRLEDGEFTGFIGTGININEQKTFAKELEEKVITRTAELKSSEEKFYNLFNLSPISKTLSDTSSGKIVMVNDAFTKLFGYSREVALGKSSAELGLLDLEAREIMINELKTNGKIENREIWFIKKSGERFIALASAEVISLGNRQFFLSAFNDISEIKKAEQDIKQKNIELENKTIQLEEAQQLAHLGSWEWDVVANKIEWSDELFRIFGLTPQEFKTDYENYLKYIHPDDREYVNSIVQQALKDHQPYSFFHKAASADGKIRILSSTGKVFTDGFGNVIRMSGTAQDVTEQKNYEENLKMSEERFYKIFDNNPVAMSLSEIKTSKIKYANNQFYNAFGYTNEEVIGRSSEELNLIDPEEMKRVVNLLFEYLLETRPLAEVQALSKEEKEALLLKLKHSEKMRDFEILYTRKNGETFPALVSFEVIRIGVDSYTVTSYQDISERKKAEAQLRIQNDQLEKMNRELESFAYISSHDLQEPLRKIQTFSTRILEKEENNLSDSGKEMFNRMQDAAKRMQTLIQDLLAYSRTTTAEHPFETIDLNKILDEVKEDLKEELNEKHATIEANQLCEVVIIPFQFRQLMHNLISNALKFSKPNHPPIIQIKSEIANGIKFKNEKLSDQNKYCHIIVSDNGIGFEEQYNEKIFEVFQRLHSKKEYEGTGIGLSIVKKIVENHSGIITATGALNKGATFDIYIPAT